ncbi:unnamed protein product [Ostreobium quekettii]|uniref:RRM domain-containing protein n=1 Tax=Ostreobium quekettii TaxID=121088 RepID=A0A8S1J0Z0_9CHLO|nr:unnamed protein product [Ostreobium quekettii]|eukprot:evm.model.scf_618.3 EVM.evm.TU.scf_618.3   scf_618:25091-25768(-)
MDVVPNQTIYVNNLYEKLGVEQMKKCLHALFSQFGRILEIVASRTYRLRGQAWVVFSDVSSATNALRTMQGFPFFDKAIRIQYARTKSDAVAKLDGTYARDKKDAAMKKAAARDEAAKRGGERAGQAAPAAAQAARAKAPAGAEGMAPPNKILFIQNLPEATNERMLSMLFQQFPGFKEVRMAEARPGIAFVEFENEGQAGVALEGLQGFKILPNHAMNVSYAKQ